MHHDPGLMWWPEGWTANPLHALMTIVVGTLTVVLTGSALAMFGRPAATVAPVSSDRE